MSDVLTISDLRRELDLPKHVIDHAIDRHGPAPVGRVGIARVWSREQLPAIRESVKKTSRSSPESLT